MCFTGMKTRGRDLDWENAGEQCLMARFLIEVFLLVGLLDEMG